MNCNNRDKLTHHHYQWPDSCNPNSMQWLSAWKLLKHSVKRPAEKLNSRRELLKSKKKIRQTCTKLTKLNIITMPTHFQTE